MGVILLIVIPVVLIVCFCLFLKWTGTRLIPEGLLLTPREMGTSKFRLPRLKRIPGRGWVEDPGDFEDVTVGSSTQGSQSSSSDRKSEWSLKT